MSIGYVLGLISNNVALIQVRICLLPPKRLLKLVASICGFLRGYVATGLPKLSSAATTRETEQTMNITQNFIIVRQLGSGLIKPAP